VGKRLLSQGLVRLKLEIALREQVKIQELVNSLQFLNKNHPLSAQVSYSKKQLNNKLKKALEKVLSYFLKVIIIL
jgi:hypothetical protein